MDLVIVIVVVAAAALYAGRQALRSLRPSHAPMGPGVSAGGTGACHCASCPAAGLKQTCSEDLRS